VLSGVDLAVRLQPRARRNAIVEERDGVLRVSVAAAPVDGQANAALCKLIAKRAGIARGRVSVIRGERSREKVVRIEGVTLEELRRALRLTAPPTPPRELRRADWPRLLSLNRASVRELSELDEQRLEWILSLAHSALAVEHEGQVAAFAVAIAPGTAYDSENYRWFGDHFQRFLYLDRIVVADSLRRRGIGAQLYDAMEAAAQPLERMVCEVNVLPVNEPSLAFHAARGYVEIARVAHGQEKVVAMMGKELQAPTRSAPS